MLIFIIEDFDKSFQSTSTKDPGKKMYLNNSRFTVKSWFTTVLKVGRTQI